MLIHIIFFLVSAFRWLQVNYIEVVAVVTGLLYVFYTIKENRVLWIFGVISSALYIIVFITSEIYAYALLYIYYVIIGCYGWYTWSVKNNDPESKGSSIVIKRASSGKIIMFLILTFVMAAPVYFLLIFFTSSDMAMMDALLTAGSMVATWMLTRKYIEQWIFWIVIDVLSCILMIFKELYPSAILFFVYTLFAIKGYLEWKKNLEAATPN